MTRRDDFKFDPSDGTPWKSSTPIQVDTYRSLHPKRVWRHNPWTGIARSGGDVVDNPFMEHVAPPLPSFPSIDEAMLKPGGVNRGALQQENSIGSTRLPVEHRCVIDNVPKFAEADPTGRSAHTPGAKMDAGKPRVWLCVSGFSRALAAVSEVTTRGAEKYAPNSWMEVPDGVDRYMEGFARHALAVGRGEKIDTGPGGTGCLHKAQMIWNLLASLELELRRDEGWARGG